MLSTAWTVWIFFRWHTLQWLEREKYRGVPCEFSKRGMPMMPMPASWYRAPSGDLGVPSARPFPVADQWSFMWFNCNCLIVDTTYDYIYIHGVVLMHVVPYRSFEIWDHTLHLRAFLGFRTIQHICPTEQAINDGTIPKWPYIVLGWWIIIGYPGLLFSVWFEMGMGRASLQSDLHMIL